MSSPATLVLLGSTFAVIAGLAGFLIYILIRYMPKVVRIFEEKPIFLPLRVPPTQDGENVRFRTRDGLHLAGTYLKARTSTRAGVVVFCHEYLSDRWSAKPYVDHLRDQGFDLFSFDFRNHGESPSDPEYKPLQWVTEHEVFDLQAALSYLRSRPDADPAGVGLFGVSRGGGTALCVASRDPQVWGVVTDGAFPTRGTMLSYILRWAEIYVGNPVFWKAMPVWIFEFLGWSARLRTQMKLHCRYSDVERAVARLAPRPWLAIHGQKDGYIGVDIAKALFERAGDPKELWIVAGAKHNRCREKDPATYLDRVSAFVRKSAPRALPAEVAAPSSESAIGPFEEMPLRSEMGIAVVS
ncbi:alpha/beta hydrolase [Tundrisphaera lichenicola]|uniref:alpha/beta hydrolase n=1 Tax=Tundrisphaera lichenicola TaxID=2029860 RepID=UPI003EBC33A2